MPLHKIADLSPGDRHIVGLDEELPIISELGKWLHCERNAVLPKLLIGKAIKQCLLKNE